MDMNSTEWLTPQEVAKLIGVRTDFVYDTCRTGGLRHTRLGTRHIRIHRDWLREWMEQHAQSHVTEGK